MHSQSVWGGGGGEGGGLRYVAISDSPWLCLAD